MLDQGHPAELFLGVYVFFRWIRLGIVEAGCGEVAVVGALWGGVGE